LGTADGTSQAGCTTGEVLLTAGNVSNGLVANGRLLSINEYPALYTLLGTQFGGNGTTDFAIPNLTQLAPNGLTYSICATGYYPTRDN
jgi:microcystin-dependent protein